MEGYEQDFVGGLSVPASCCAPGRSTADTEHVAEEIEDIGRRDVRELDSRMQVLWLVC
jgi:hypothetical protein